MSGFWHDLFHYHKWKIEKTGKADMTRTDTGKVTKAIFEVKSCLCGERKATVYLADGMEFDVHPGWFDSLAGDSK